jgi:hypothetical protein
VVSRRLRFACALALAFSPALACHKTLRASVAQPNPLRITGAAVRESEALEIVTGDMELAAPPGGPGQVLGGERYPLRNRASFTVVSRDRLRFHVQLEHKWREWADVHTWEALVADDRGRRFAPVAIDGSPDRHVVLMWDQEARSTVRDRFGDPVQVRHDAHLRRRPLASMSLFRGRGDFVFFAPDLFTPAVKWIKLTLRRGRVSFDFTWYFAESRA